MSMCRALLPLLIVVVGGTGVARAAPPQEREKILGVIYDVSALAGKMHTTGDKGGTPALIGLVMSTVRPHVWGAKDSPHAIYELHGKKLEIYTTADNHGEIVDLLAALERLTDVAVVVESGLYEVERGFYDREIAPQLAKLPGVAPALPIESELNEKLQKATKLLKSGKTKLENGEDGLFFAVRRALPTPTQMDPIAFPGVAFHGRFVVSADRRELRIKLVQKTTDLLRIGKEATFDAKQGKRVVVDVPELQETSVSASVTVGDGLLILVPVRARIPGVTVRKDHVLVMLLRPTIYIREEEELLRKQ